MPVQRPSRTPILVAPSEPPLSSDNRLFTDSRIRPLFDIVSEDTAVDSHGPDAFEGLFDYGRYRSESEGRPVELQR